MTHRAVRPVGPGVNIPWNHAEVNAAWYSEALDELKCTWACDFKYKADAFVPMAWELRQGWWPEFLQYANHPNRSEHMNILWNEPNVYSESDASPGEVASTINYFRSQSGASWTGPVVLWHYNGESWLDEYFALGGKFGTMFTVDIYAISIQHFLEQWEQIKRALDRWRDGTGIVVAIQEFAHFYDYNKLLNGSLTLSQVQDMQIRLIDAVFDLAERDSRLIGWGYFSAHYGSYVGYYTGTDMLNKGGIPNRIASYWNARVDDYMKGHSYMELLTL